MKKIAIVVAAGLLLAGCSSGPDAAVEGCIAAAAQNASDNIERYTSFEMLMAVTTRAAVGCVESDGYSCSAETAFGEWSPGFYKMYDCGTADDQALIGPIPIQQALSRIGVPV